jgi:5-methyltetrahydropteroyltriglutamate--homocysteine methyltransferase
MISTKPPFKADIVGSLLRPPAIHDARARRKAGEISAEALWALESACVQDAVALQHDVGLRVCTDGDYHRRHWFLDFMERIDGIAIRGSLPTQFHTESGDVEWAPPRIEVHGKLRRTRELAVGDFRALRPIAERYGLTPKQTLPSPSIAHFAAGARRCRARRTRTSTNSSPISPPCIAQRSRRSTTRAAATCRSTR